MNDIQAAADFVDKLWAERRELISESIGNMSGRHRGAIIALQNEIDAAEVALAAERKRRDDRSERRDGSSDSGQD